MSNTTKQKAREEISLGDRVWVGDSRNPRYHLRVVTKLTPTQIVLESGSRYRRDSLSVIRGDIYDYRITGVATPEECETWDAEQEAKRREAEQRREEIERTDAERRELNALFGDNASVTDKDGGWVVSIRLDEGGVRALAALLGSKAEGAHE